MSYEYTAKEQAIVDHVFEIFEDAGKMDHKDQVVAGAIDILFKQVIGETKKYGCIIDFGGGVRTKVEPFAKRIWSWAVIGVILIRYKGEAKEMEDELREAVNLLAGLFEGNHTLGGITPLVQIERIDQADVTQLNDIPFYWLPFQMTILEGPD